MSNIRIKTADLEDMKFLCSLAQEEGWNPGINDAIPFYAADPQGFFIGELDGKKVGCISAVKYDDTYSFLGFYIIIPEFRGQGYGTQLGKHVFEYLGNCAMGLDGVVAQQGTYKSLGFVLRYRNHRYQCYLNAEPQTSLADSKNIPFQDILTYDIPIFGVDRSQFLEKWLKMPESYSLVKLSQGRVVGYGMIRKCHVGWKIGPLFADDLSIAEEIFHGLCAKTSEKGPFFFDVPEINEKAVQIAEKYQMEKVFETARMYKGEEPSQQLEKCFGVTTFELG